MLHTSLLLDCSAPMAETSQELPPTRILGLRAHLAAFVSHYFSSSPLALLGACSMRDGMAAELSPLCADPAAVQHALETRYFLAAPSGALSLENGLRAALRVLGVDPTDVAAKGPSATDAISQRRVLLVTASVSTLDPGDILALVAACAQQCVRCDVISLAGALRVFQHLAHETGGTFVCPTESGGDSLRAPLLKLAQPPVLADPGRGSTMSSRGAVFQVPLPGLRGAVAVGFPIPTPATLSTSSTVTQSRQTTTCREIIAEAQRQVQPCCPRCLTALSAVPSVCGVCGLLCCGPLEMDVAFLTATRIMATSTPLVVQHDDCGATGIVTIPRCSGCGEALPAGLAARACARCHGWRCVPCDEFLCNVVKACPTCR